MLRTKNCRNRRFYTRFNKTFPVLLSSKLYGKTPAIARNVSQGGMMVEITQQLPLGSWVTVHFTIPGSEVDFSLRAQVKHQYSFNFSVGDKPAYACGVGLHFREFLHKKHEHFASLLQRARTLH